MKPIIHATAILLEEFVRYVKNYEKSPNIDFAIHCGRPSHFPITSCETSPSSHLKYFSLIDLSGSKKGELNTTFEQTLCTPYTEPDVEKTIERALSIIDGNIELLHAKEENKISLKCATPLEFYAEKNELGDSALHWLEKLLAIYQKKLEKH